MDLLHEALKCFYPIIFPAVALLRWATLWAVCCGLYAVCCGLYAVLSSLLSWAGLGCSEPGSVCGRGILLFCLTQSDGKRVSVHR